MTLRNVDDKEFLSVYGSIPKWVKSLDISDLESVVVEKLVSERVTLTELLHPQITQDQILAVLNNLQLKAGITLKILGNIANVRTTNTNAIARALEMANDLKVKELQIAAQNKFHTEESATTKNKQVFISYSWANKHITKKLYEVLTQKGFSCWFDESAMQGGSQLFGAIDEGISGCKVFVACCSNNYGPSVNCQRELLLATDRKKFIIPTLIGITDPWPPKGQMGPLLAGKLYIDISNDEKFEKTVDQLVTTIQQSLS